MTEKSNKLKITNKMQEAQVLYKRMVFEAYKYLLIALLESGSEGSPKFIKHKNVKLIIYLILKFFKGKQKKSSIPDFSISDVENQELKNQKWENLRLRNLKLETIKLENLLIEDYVTPQQFMEILNGKFELRYKDGSANNINLSLDLPPFIENHDFFVKILSKHHINIIWMSYHLFKVCLTYFPIYDEFYLMSSESRRMILTKGCVFWKSGGEIKYQELKRHFLLSNKGSIRQKIVQECSYIPKENLFLWLGCHMSLPDKTKITLSFDRLYPNLYLGMNKKSNSNMSEEIFIEENPWSVNAVYNKGMLTDYDNNHSIETNQLNPFQFSLNMFSESNDKYKPDEPKEFKRRDLNANNDSNDYDLILTIPYVPPKADMLVSMKIRNHNPECKCVGKCNCDDFEEVILSST